MWLACGLMAAWERAAQQGGHLGAHPSWKCSVAVHHNTRTADHHLLEKKHRSRLQEQGRGSTSPHPTSELGVLVSTSCVEARF